MARTEHEENLMSISKVSSCRLVVLALCLGVLALPVAAQTLYKTGFEASEGFTPGSIQNQNGWKISGNDVWAVNSSAGKAGGAGLEITGIGTTWAWPSAGLATSSGVVTFSVDAFLNPNQPSTNLQTSIGLDVFAPSSLVGYNSGLIASLRVAPLTPPVNPGGFGQGAFAQLYGNWNNSSLPFWLMPNTVPSSGVIPVGSWFNLALELNFDTGTYRGLINGQNYGLASAIPFWVPGLTISDFDLYARKEAQSTVRFDNLEITAVPEPATIIALAIGTTIFIRKKKRSSK
ncbi:MAG: PEP-CTERM sorting domain-containing protein [Fimbriimonadaceae bacterium]|jgi:hypothetical protein|nr:PEP-CTERM sorting domain-containing protein [Fimbriimonadaceae bacterium]